MATTKTRTRRRKERLELPQEQLLEFLRTMILIRRFEERARELFVEGAVKGTAHSSVGQEAVAVGACTALEPEDFVVSHHRGHGHCLAKGARADRMMAELFGKEAGYCRGLGGSMHVADLSLNILGANGIVGAGMGIGTGAALSAVQRGTEGCGVVFFGDGAANEGLFHEAMNFTAIKRLPMIFLCENNQYGLSGSSADMLAGGSVAARAAGYGVPGERIDGNDVIAVHQTVARAVARARAGEGPTLIEALTYRWGEHSMRANLPAYRTEEEQAMWRARDPIANLVDRLRDAGALTDQRLARVEAEVEAEIERAVAFAHAAEEPTPAILETAVYPPAAAEEAEPAPPPDGARELPFAQAINEALRQEMERDEAVFVIGEDVAKIGGIFGATRGLLEAFGPLRVIDTPISEMVIAGAGVGSAVTGRRPVIEVQIFDFVTLMMDMIVNQAAKFRFMLGGGPKVPLVIRGPQGGGIRLAAQHSQSLEAWFTHVPGLTVVAPSTPYDAKGLLAAAIRHDGPVIFLEHKLLYVGQPGPVPEEAYVLPIGKADVKREGRDATLVATMSMVERALAAARVLARQGIEVEVIDPRTLHPLDEATIVESVRKTNRLVVVHEAPKRGGFGAEVASMVLEHAFDHLDAPVVRLGAPHVPMPYNDRLERAVIPSQDDIVAAVLSVCYRDEAAGSA